MNHPQAPDRTTPHKRHKKTSPKRWIWLIASPFILLVVIAIAQMAVRFVLGSAPMPESNAGLVLPIVNVISIIAGVVAIILLVLIPLWIVMLVNDADGGNRSKAIALVLAVVFGPFAWIYTYRDDALKFWLNTVLSVISFGLWAIVGWIWVIIDYAVRPDEYFEKYGHKS